MTPGVALVVSEKKIFTCISSYKTTSPGNCTADLIRTIIFATQIVHFFLLLIMKFQVSSLLLRLYRPVCVRPGLKPKDKFFLHRSSYGLK